MKKSDYSMADSFMDIFGFKRVKNKKGIECLKCGSKVYVEKTNNGFGFVWHGVCDNCGNVEAYREPDDE